MEKHRVITYIILISLVILVAGCVSNPMKGKYEHGFMDVNGTRIAYIYRPASTKAILFLHQMNGRKEDWLGLMEKLPNFTVMAIDLRGHGESGGNWRKFSEADFLGMIDDERAAEEFLRQRNRTVYAVVGASIGANLALLSDAPKVVALSPGLNYHGIVPHARQALIIVGRGDSYAYQSSLRLGNPMVEKCSCHGTALLPLAEDIIIKYLAGNSQ